ncbi:hypothetical protein M9H77_11752 [Catharanthus roseus]|uniref:Uncharacterized protein n=1 Tax=Catharanthus roseus TaxID=4058 RepID=A0ACC0BFJ6_CATRO|nr:hypothetical protein M9H77_11752 [Catharanthus roseus]
MAFRQRADGDDSNGNMFKLMTELTTVTVGCPSPTTIEVGVHTGADPTATFGESLLLSPSYSFHLFSPSHSSLINPAAGRILAGSQAFSTANKQRSDNLRVVDEQGAATILPQPFFVSPLSVIIHL